MLPLTNRAALGKSLPCPKLLFTFQSGKGFTITVGVLEHSVQGPDSYSSMSGRSPAFLCLPSQGSRAVFTLTLR